MVKYQGLLQISNILYLSLQSFNSKLLSPASPNLILLGINLKSKSEKTVKPFRIYSDYQQPKISVVNNDSAEEEEIEKVILDDKIEVNSSDNEDDIEIKKVGV